MPNSDRQILIVDDSQDIRNLIRVSLVNQGYSCHTADGSQAAMSVLQKETIDLALLDIVMPGMTGISLFKQIKEEFPETAIIFVTSIDDMNLAFDSVKDGAYDYVLKSKIPHRLIQAVEQALSRRDAAAEKNRQLVDLQSLVERQAEQLQQQSQEITALNQLVRSRLEGHSEESA
ncbi:MAG: response regulator [Chloroflexi bacterium]|nr:response regulator [Chloroflexota bacterium]